MISTTQSKKHIFPKNILKWVGGKSQILSNLLSNFPIQIHNYYEPFLGGGSVLLGLLTLIRSNSIKLTGNIYASDANEPLIYVYKNIQTRHMELYDYLQTIIKDFNECGNGPINRKPQTIKEAKINKENYYYWIRNKYNKLSDSDKKEIGGSAMFIFLNKTCFRGVFRIGPNGFNVPYGNYKNPEIIHIEHLTDIHNLIQNVIFESCDFNQVFGRVKMGDFVYLDPPYAPETTTSFVGYTKGGFNLGRHNELFELIHSLTNQNIKATMSNSDVQLIRDNFKTDKYRINTIVCKRSINSNKPQSKTMEVIINNY